MNNFLGIIGGLGPFASAYFYKLLTDMTYASSDQEHINLIILSHPTIPDRTSYLLDKENNENPFPLLKDDIKKLSDLGASLIFIPCNTCTYFINDLQKETNVPILNMINDTIDYLIEKGKKRVVILATTGTIKTKLYQTACENKGLNYIVPDGTIQNKIMHIIYNNIKANENIEIDVWKEIEESFENADAFILGCTELSILKEKLYLGEMFVDPLRIEATKILEFYGKKINTKYISD